MKSFREYRDEDWKYITTMDVEFYPDYLEAAQQMYKEPQERFKDLALKENSSEDLYRAIMNEPQRIRTKILSVFSKYVSPNTKTELLKRKGKMENTIQAFGNEFRSLEEVKDELNKRPCPDEAISALLYQYRDRGKPGYDLTDMFFTWFEEKFGDKLKIDGPIREGQDIILNKVIEDFPQPYPVDFLITDKTNSELLVIGFARYDSDRGGSQEDDRTGGNRDKVPTILKYAEEKGVELKILFLNDGPGLLLGSMWNDYATIEEDGKGKVMVSTLKMLEERFSEDWIRG